MRRLLTLEMTMKFTWFAKLEMKCLLTREWWHLFFCLCYPCSSPLHPSYFPTLIRSRAASVPWWVMLNFNIQEHYVWVCIPGLNPQSAWKSPGDFKTCSFLEGQGLKLLLFSLYGPGSVKSREGETSACLPQMTKLRCSLWVTADERWCWADLEWARSFGTCSPLATHSCALFAPLWWE